MYSPGVSGSKGWSNERNGVHRRAQFQLTLIDSSTLFTRLNQEVRFISLQAQKEWNDFERTPAPYIRRRIDDSVRRVELWSRSPNKVAAATTSLAAVVSISLIVVVLDHSRTKLASTSPADDEVVSVIDLCLLPLISSVERSGFTADSQGRVGLNRGTGEGSLREPKKSHGGGGGGDHQPAPPQQGAIPPPSEIPAPIPAVAQKNHALPAAGVDLDPALWKALPFAQYGDPRSTSTQISNGSGSKGGMGTGDGTGVGEGSGDGIGKGEDGNTGGGDKAPGGGSEGGGPGCGYPACFGSIRVFKASEVGQRAQVLNKPEPQYTEEARRNQITGTVTLRVVFSWSGEVTNIRAISSLPLGLTERAIAAAKQIRFVPAMQGGRPVSVFMQLEYNFNLY